MKRILLLLGVVLLLTACGNDETEETSAEPVEETDETVQVEATSNAMDFADKTNNFTVYDEYLYDYETIARYTHDKEDDRGINEITFDDVTFRFGVLAVEEEDTGDQYIVLAGEAENNTEETVYFAPHAEVVTSEQEQSESYNEGVGDMKPTVIKDAFSMIPIERGVPDSFEIIIYPPYTDDDEHKDIGTPIKAEFTLE